MLVAIGIAAQFVRLASQAFRAGLIAQQAAQLMAAYPGYHLIVDQGKPLGLAEDRVAALNALYLHVQGVGLMDYVVRLPSGVGSPELIDQFRRKGLLVQ